MSTAEEHWRSPVGQAAAPPTPKAGYPGPPVGAAPPADWHPPVDEPVPVPRRLPDLDHDAMDLAEHRAARFTYGVAAAAALVLSLAVCLRVLL